MAYGQPSGTTAYDPSASDLVVDAFGRCGIFDLTGKHMQSARRSANLLLASAWSNRGANLFKISDVVVPLINGVATYNLTRNIATVYDCFRRVYAMNQAANFTVSFTTVLDSDQVTIDIPGAAAKVGTYIGLQVPVSVGGIVLNGFYLVTATPTANSATVTGPNVATASVPAGGVVPQFVTTAGSPIVTVNFPAHGLLPGQPFNIGVSTLVGQITLFGSYTVATVTSADAFTIAATSNALANDSQYENGGDAYIAVQNTVAPYTDIIMEPMSRTDYASQSNKQAQGQPSNIWVDKQIIPQFTLWPVPDNLGPYEAHLYCMSQIQDVNPTGGQTLDLPPRFLYAYTLDLARDLSMTWAPDRYAMLKTEAIEAWAAAEATDIEGGSTYILPSMPSGL